jgi:hypothetical protein
MVCNLCIMVLVFTYNVIYTTNVNESSVCSICTFSTKLQVTVKVAVSSTFRIKGLLDIIFHISESYTEQPHGYLICHLISCSVSQMHSLTPFYHCLHNMVYIQSKKSTRYQFYPFDHIHNTATGRWIVTFNGPLSFS